MDEGNGANYDISGNRHGLNWGEFGIGAPRPLVNQPKDFDLTHSGMRHYICKRHEFSYYPESWKDSEGTYWRSGYYDENGEFYQNIGVKNTQTIMTCGNCGYRFLYTWKDRSSLYCSSCDRFLDVSCIDELEHDIDGYNASLEGSERRMLSASDRRIFMIMFMLIFMILFFGILNIL